MSDLFGHSGVNAMHGHHAHYPEKPAKGKRDTSREAAESIAPRAGTLQASVLAELERAGPLATYELAARLKVRYGSIQPRTSELSKLGKIRDSGKRRQDPETGKNVIVWEICR